MATVFWTPDAADIGSVPSDVTYTVPWNSVYSITVENDATLGNHLKIVWSESATSARRIVRISSIGGLSVGSVNDIEIYAKYRIGGISGDFYTGGRVSGTAGSESYVWSRYNRGSGNTRTLAYSNPSSTAIDADTTGTTTFIVRHVRLRLNGTSASVKFWDEGASEPASWTFSGTQSAVTTGGGVGLGRFSLSSSLEMTEFYAIGVGTEGDTAPTSGTGTPVAFSGTISGLTATVGNAFSHDLSSYFSGTETPFTYALTTGSLPAYASFNTTTCVLSGTPDTDTDITGLSITATDQNTDTALSNTFAITVNAAATVPQGTTTVTGVNPGETAAEITYTYDDTDQTGFEYRLDGGTATSLGTSPATISGLTAGTTYSIEVRAVNATGAGTWSTAVNFTTDTAATAPTGTVTISGVNPSETSAVVTYSYDAADQTGFEYRLDAGTAAAIGASPATITGLTGATTYDVQVRAVNAEGPGNWSTAFEFTTDAPSSTVIATEPWGNNTATAVFTNQTGVIAHVLNAATLETVHRATGLTTDASGVLEAITDASITAGNDYIIVVRFSDGSVGVTEVITAT